VTRVVAVLGPTGIGKSSLGLELAERFGGEIVSADSIQLYRYLDIGSAKPTLEERARAPHHLVDIVDPDQEYTAADFERDALAAVGEIHGRGALPVVVGGTALYMRVLLWGLCEAPPADEGIRRELALRAEREGWPALHAELAQLDPVTAARVHPNDRIRIERGLEVVLASGKPISEYQLGGFADPRYPSFIIGLNVPREQLYERINGRVEQMISSGWFEEVESLLARGYDAQLKPLQAIGYRDVVACLQGTIDREEAVRRIQRDTRRFAKRQLTWFLKEEGIRWHEPGPGLADELMEPIRRFLAAED